MSKKPIKIAVTGAAGNIGYALLFRLAAGYPFGPDQPVSLKLIEIEPAMKALEGTVMELNDCAFPLLHDIEITSDINTGFADANWVLLVGSVPRKAGMERSDLLGINGKIFTAQGKAIAKNSAPDVRILVVGNPCNTNCLIAQRNAPGIPADRWFAMTRLDQNRAKAQLSAKAGKDFHTNDISRMVIWGNHSATQYPDFKNALIKNKPVTETIADNNWLENDFIKTVQQRGAEIIKARGASSAASAANAALDSVHSIITPTPDGDAFSLAIYSDGSYGIEEGIIASMPMKSDGKNLSIVQGFEIDDFSRQKIDASVAELIEEKNIVTSSGLIP